MLKTGIGHLIESIPSAGAVVEYFDAAVRPLLFLPNEGGKFVINQERSSIHISELNGDRSGSVREYAQIISILNNRTFQCIYTVAGKTTEFVSNAPGWRLVIREQAINNDPGKVDNFLNAYFESISHSRKDVHANHLRKSLHQAPLHAPTISVHGNHVLVVLKENVDSLLIPAVKQSLDEIRRLLPHDVLMTVSCAALPQPKIIATRTFDSKIQTEQFDCDTIASIVSDYHPFGDVKLLDNCFLISLRNNPISESALRDLCIRLDRCSRNYVIISTPCNESIPAPDNISERSVWNRCRLLPLVSVDVTQGFMRCVTTRPLQPEVESQIIEDLSTSLGRPIVFEVQNRFTNNEVARLTQLSNPVRNALWEFSDAHGLIRASRGTIHAAIEHFVKRAHADSPHTAHQYPAVKDPLLMFATGSVDSFHEDAFSFTPIANGFLLRWAAIRDEEAEHPGSRFGELIRNTAPIYINGLVPVSPVRYTNLVRRGFSVEHARSAYIVEMQLDSNLRLVKDPTFTTGFVKLAHIMSDSLIERGIQAKDYSPRILEQLSLSKQFFKLCLEEFASPDQDKDFSGQLSVFVNRALTDYCVRNNITLLFRAARRGDMIRTTLEQIPHSGMGEKLYARFGAPLRSSVSQMNLRSLYAEVLGGDAPTKELFEEAAQAATAQTADHVVLKVLSQTLELLDKNIRGNLVYSERRKGFQADTALGVVDVIMSDDKGNSTHPIFAEVKKNGARIAASLKIVGFDITKMHPVAVIHGYWVD